MAAVFDSPRGLIYTSDSEPGIRRKRCGKGFSFLDPNGTTIRDKTIIERIKSLAIPPAYDNVWICPDPNGHIQATGHDAKRRKQYRYHPKWLAARNEQKFEHLLEFGESLPAIRAQVDADLSLHNFPKQRVVALVVRLLDDTLIRVGNEAYAKKNKSFGLTTLLTKHVEANTSSVEFKFVGKSGKPWNIKTRDRRLARIVRSLQDLPGQRLFQYKNELGDVAAITSQDVNAYLSEIAGNHVTAKDFRTWAGSREALRLCLDLPEEATQAQQKRNVNAIVKQVAQILGNTPAVCRSSYIHPAIIASAFDQEPYYMASRLDPDQGLLQFLRHL